MLWKFLMTIAVFALLLVCVFVYVKSFIKFFTEKVLRKK